MPRDGAIVFGDLVGEPCAGLEEMPVAAKPIDVWDVGTLDSALIALLETRADLIRDYLETNRQNFLSYDRGGGHIRPILRPKNPHASDFMGLQEAISREMERRTIRAFHYTRLTDDEVVNLQREGIHLSTPASLQSRLDDIVAAGGLTRAAADQLYANSPFHSDQLEARSGKFWMTSHPVAVDDGGVRPLMEHWGGEVASMWIKDEALLAPLASLGRPRIIEVAVPMCSTRQSFSAGTAIIATFARSRGCVPEKRDFDLYVHQPLTPAAILAAHAEGDAPFVEMGRGYPAGFIDVAISWWKEYTGEED
jgi:hypothetical protein